MTKEERTKKDLERQQYLAENQKSLAEGHFPVFGIDEAGRGPLCGPVIAACCVLPNDFCLPGLNDSKKLSEQKREQLYREITACAVSYGIGSAGPERIDEINILNATLEAMKEAWENCCKYLHESSDPGSDVLHSGIVLVDGNRRIPGIDMNQKTVVKGDATCASIAAASILAKVTRDRMLHDYDILYPEYGFGKHKGYGTAEHVTALLNYGPLPIHRKSFLKKIFDQQ